MISPNKSQIFFNAFYEESNPFPWRILGIDFSNESLICYCPQIMCMISPADHKLTHVTIFG